MSEMKRKPYDVAVEKLIEFTASTNVGTALAACDLLLKHVPSGRTQEFVGFDREGNADIRDRGLMPVPFFDNDDKAVFTTPEPGRLEDAEYEKRFAAGLKSEIDKIEESRQIIARLKYAKGVTEQSLSDFVDELLDPRQYAARWARKSTER